MIKYNVDKNGVVELKDKDIIYCAQSLADIYDIPFDKAKEMVIHSPFEDDIEYYQIHNEEIDYSQCVKNVYTYHKKWEHMQDFMDKIRVELKDKGITYEQVHKLVDDIRNGRE